MKRVLLVLALLALGSTLALAAPRPKPWTPSAAPASATATAAAIDEDPDLPSDLGGLIDKTEYLQARSNAVNLRYSDANAAEVAAGRAAAVEQLQRQKTRQGPFTSASTWTPIGPWPIPNGQTTSIATAISGRVSAIAVHPTNPDIVYVGTAQGGVYRSLDGGASWVAIFDNAASLAIGALALAPTNPSILYVGTGEANGSADSFFGVGLYRVDNADTAPVLNGPFNPTPTTDVIGAKTFTGRTISSILVDPADAGTIFVGTASGIGGLGGEAFASSPPISALRGVYRSTNATTASPSFAKLTVTTSGSIAPDVTGNAIINDLCYDPGDATGNTLVVWVNAVNSAGNGGIYRTITAKAPFPTFTQVLIPTTSGSRGQFAVTRAGNVTTMYLAAGESTQGRLRKSLDGGATWSAALAGGLNFCGGQCFYDIAIDVSPVDANLVLLGGSSGGNIYLRSTNGGTSFTNGNTVGIGLHADTHAIKMAPSNPNIVYQGSDGGIWKSVDNGLTWTSLNIYPFSAAQYQSIDVHPIDPNFSIGGTQDNGTQMYKPNATWNRIDFGDGGFAVIDQNATDNTNVTMYHTYFNQRNNLVGYARAIGVANAADGLWPFFGAQGVTGANGFIAGESVNFYAPLVRGPGNPNPIYYGSDRLHRSVDGGATNPVVSQAPIVGTASAGSPISTIAIAPLDDNVRLVGLNNSQIWGTVTGSSTLVNMTGAGMPVKYIGRIMIDPTNSNVAYVCFGGFNIPAGQHVWKTTNLLTGTPTWTASGTGLADVPVNAIAIDPTNPAALYAGTDVGVYTSADGGATWAPYTTGMPVVSVFDMKIQQGARILRVATHGRGMWERFLDQPVATQLALVGTEIVNGHPKMTWYSADGARETMKLYRRAVPGNLDYVSDILADGSGQISYEDVNAVAGRSYEYAIGITSASGTRIMGNVWVDVPVNAEFSLKALPVTSNALSFVVSLPEAGSARIELVDITGRMIAKQDLGTLAAGQHSVNVSASLKPGIYWARLSQAGKMAATKVAVVR
jgi:hypothetical protein